MKAGSSYWFAALVCKSWFGIFSEISSGTLPNIIIDSSAFSSSLSSDELFLLL